MKTYFLLIVFGFLGLTSVAQVVNPTLKTVDDVWRAHQMENGKPLIGNSAIAGNPYLNRNFKGGKLISRYNMKFPVVPLRYNIFTDNIEYKSIDGNVYVLEGQNKIKFYKIGDTTLIYSPYYKNKDKLASGYFQVLVQGNTKALIKYTIYLLQAHPTQPYKPAEPARYSEVIKSFYLKVDSSAAVPVSRAKTILHLFPKHKNQLNQYIRDKDLHIRKQADFVKLVKYIDTLTSTTAGNKK